MQSTQLLIDLIRNKQKVLMQLREIGRRQADMATCGDVDAVLKLLAIKQDLISSLQEIERHLTRYYGQDPDRREWPSPAARAECARQAVECNALLAEIVQLEKLGAETMTARRNEVAQQLQHVHAATNVRSAYEAQRRTLV